MKPNTTIEIFELYEKTRAVKRNFANVSTSLQHEEEHESNGVRLWGRRKRRNARDEELVLSHSSLQDSAEEGLLEHVFGSGWVLRANVERAWRNMASVLLIVLFILHAPVSQRFIYYFACENIDETRSFLRSNYNVECNVGSHRSFRPFVILVIVSFTFCLPLVICLQLCRYRKILHTAAVRQRFGFLYVNFNRGAEFWEILEVFRKLSLTGLLVFVPNQNYRAITAVVICVVSVANLNYLKPHRNIVVFLIAECSFLLSTFKYLALVLLTSNQDSVQEGGTAGLNSISGEGRNNPNHLGILLIVLDMLFVLASSISVIALAWLLHNDIKKTRKKVSVVHVAARKDSSKDAKGSDKKILSSSQEQKPSKGEINQNENDNNVTPNKNLTSSKADPQKSSILTKCLELAEASKEPEGGDINPDGMALKVEQSNVKSSDGIRSKKMKQIQNRNILVKKVVPSNERRRGIGIENIPLHKNRCCPEALPDS